MYSLNRTKRLVLVLAAFAGLIFASWRLTAEPTVGGQDRLVVSLVTTFLQQAHLTRPEIGDDISRRLFKQFLKDLDPTKLYFLSSDIEDFKKYETELDDQLRKGDLSFAYKVYERLVTRVGERFKLVEELINDSHDFTVNETLDTNYDKLDWAKSEAELKERWRRRIKFDLLMHRVGQKPLPETEAKQKVLSRYQSVLKRWKQLDNYELLELYLSALTASVDPHSSYMSPATLDDFSISMRLQLEGIGALLRSENGQTIVAEIIPGGAAAADGRLKTNDKIIGVAQGDSKFIDVIDMKLRDVVKLIRGARGTKVELKVLPAEKHEPVVYNMTRQKIELKDQEARSEIIDMGKKADGKPYRIGVLDLPSFYSDMKSARGEAKSATEDVRKILNDFNTKGVDGVILDLRRNGGGALNEALALTGLFIDRGPVVQVKGFDGRVQVQNDPEKGVVYGGPLVVLVSKLSASASEILAGALQDYGRALVVGDSATHGKGTVQLVIDLGNQVQPGNPPKLGALKLTINQFYRVNGDSTQSRGVVPDLILPALTEHLGMAESELDHALAFDRIQPVQHEQLNMVPEEVKAALKAKSSERIKNSEDFTKLAKEMEDVKNRREKKQIPLNEKELKERFSKDDAEKAEQKLNGFLPQEKSESENGVYKFTRNFQNNEILQIMEDFLQGKKIAQSK